MHKDIKKKPEGFKSIKLGQVDFINCLPINLPLESGAVKINAEIVSGVPTHINKMILNNEADIAPVSSLAYLENKDKLTPLGNLCIASDGPADSVLLFSHFPAEELHGAKISLTYASSTSNLLLQIILKEFLNVEAEYEVNNLSLGKISRQYPAALYIGDHALYEFSTMPRNIFVYDLGQLWKKYTGLPMTFGLWVASNDVINNYPLEVNEIKRKLFEAKNIGLGPMFDEVLKRATKKMLISKDFYSSYFQHLSYDFTDKCMEGLNLFENYSKKLKRAVLTTAN